MSSKRIQTVRVKKPKTQQEKKMATIARSQALKVVNKNIESKLYNGKLALSGTTIDYTGTMYSIFSDVPAGTTITQGVAQSQYIGEKIRPTHISVRYALTNESADTNNIMTCVIIQAKGASLPGGSFVNIFQSVGNVSAPLSPFSDDYDDRFRVLYRKTVSLTLGTDNLRTYKVNIPYNKLAPIVFLDPAGTIEANGIYIGWISDSGIAVHPTVRAQWRLFYKDA